MVDADLRLDNVSLAPPTAVPDPIFIPFPGLPPPEPPTPIPHVEAPPYRPCFYDKHNSKPRGPGTSWSCVANGYTVATGKYGLINLDKQGKQVGWQRDESTGKLQQISDPELFEGTEQGVVQAAPAPTT